MRALTIKMPFAQYIVEGRKTIEVRSKPTKILNEPVVICVGKKSINKNTCEDYHKENDKVFGHAVCVVEFIHCTPFRDLPYFWDRAMLWREIPLFYHLLNGHAEETFCWDSSKFWAWHINFLFEVEPFPVQGKQGFFQIDDSLIEELSTNSPLAMKLNESAQRMAWKQFYYRRHQEWLACGGNGIPF